MGVRKAFELNINMLEEILDVLNDEYEQIEYVDIAEYNNKEKILIRLVECMLSFNEDIHNEMIEDEIYKILSDD
tara:strand:- start:4395 stop:4616 length:222 start_codon:yes stop_codon:yes gene_type:complete